MGDTEHVVVQVTGREALRVADRYLQHIDAGGDLTMHEWMHLRSAVQHVLAMLPDVAYEVDRFIAAHGYEITHMETR